jgi:hypothetical protein
MEKIVYSNESSKLVANASGGVIELTQFYDGEAIGTVSLYFEEVKELNDFISSLNQED